ncbi:MAG TPA: hypothetical protein VFM55_15095 [Micromonosporaceae bacterium]|nr:hypothetical protein [Micromonosporaceae bacterium]
MSTDERVVPFHCPFCGEEDLRPADAAPRAWECRGCTRVFTVTLVGLRTREVRR